MKRLDVKDYSDIQKQIPLFMSVYESKFPLFGDTKNDKNIELIVRSKPPGIFLYDFNQRLTLTVCFYKF